MSSSIYYNPFFVSISEQGVGPYDIAMIKLTTPVTFNDYVNAVCLPTYTGQFPVGTQCYTSGWGKTHMNQGRSNRLLNYLRVIYDTKIFPFTVLVVTYHYAILNPLPCCRHVEPAAAREHVHHL